MPTTVYPAAGATSGSYTPTFTAIAGGPSAFSAVQAFTYLRVGPLVQVHGQVDVTCATIPGDNQFDITLPIATTSAILSGVLTGSSLPLAANTDMMFAMGPIQSVNVPPRKARCFFSLALSNAPNHIVIAVSFQYIVA